MTKGYHSYRGKTGAGRIALIVFLCLVLFAAIGFLVLQRYIVYEVDGGVRIELPWGKKNPEKEQENTGAVDGAGGNGDLEIVVEKPEETGQALHAYELEESVLRGGVDAALDALPEDADTVAVRVKNERGELLYPSKLPAAMEAGAVAGGSISQAVVEDLVASRYHTIARISALHDSVYSFAHMEDAAILQLQHPGYIWYDPDSTFYLAPEKPLTREYLAGIARECAEMGFDELLFDSFGYPTEGRLSNIDESQRTESKREALALLAGALKESVKGYNVKLSVVLDAETVLAGENEAAGQYLPGLAESFDRIYVSAQTSQLPELNEAVKAYDVELVPILERADGESSYLIEP